MATSNYVCPDGTPFPVEWPDAEMAKYGWRWDQLHNPTPLTPLAEEMSGPKREGMLRGGISTGRPFGGGERFFVHGYGFSRAIPPSDEERSLFRLVAERDAESRLGRLTELWESSYRPESEALTRAMHAWAGADDSLSDLMNRFDEVEAITSRLGELHTMAMGLTGVGWAAYQEFCKSEFGDDGEQLALDTISGIPNKSMESADVMWNLARQIAACPEVAELLRSTGSSEFMSVIDSVTGGDECRSLIEAFLDQWGYRNESFQEISFPTWKEDPAFLITTLRGYLDTPDERSPSEMHRRVMALRERRTEEAKVLLGPGEKADEFSELLRIAQQRTAMIEDHNFYIDQRGHSSLRSPCLAIGDRLVAQGSIDDAGDVFYLYRHELVGAAEDAGVRYQTTVSERRAERDAWMGVLPPSTIGAGEIVMDAMQAAFTGHGEIEPAEPGTVKGLAASRGTVRGTARLVLTLDDADKLKPGDILVTYATTPPWTPLFSIASAVVTDTGGPLAHCAVVAREYGIPAVVGTRVGTSEISDGALITVDGSAGIVTIER